MSNEPNHVVVIGGGVIGAYTAYYLARQGRRVTLIDKGAFGHGCSHGNCGLICPSHVLPLSQPGAVSKALKAMLGRNTPFKIKPRFDPELWGWLWRFMRACKKPAMLASGRARAALLNSSMELYLKLLDEEGLDCEWEHRGVLFVYMTESGMEHYGQTDALVRKHFGIGATRYDGDALIELEPALRPGVAGGWHYECDAHVRPDRLMAEMKRVLNKHHVTIYEHTPVNHFIRDSATGKARAVFVGGPETTGHDITADAFVLATGALAPKFQEALGVRLRIQPGKGYSITMPRPERCPAIPMIFQEHKVAVTPMRTGYRLGSLMEFNGYDDSIEKHRVKLLEIGARPYLYEPTAEPIEETWTGWRPMTPDGVPLIGPSRTFSNVVVAAGHSMVGMSMGPASGRLAAELVTGQRPHVEPRHYDPRLRG
ncbi:MAG: FAD-dependent oxidoreductase [Phycisphaera sp.]|nr:FAD-dependent oxidoreductase [Phycisphaera sp.]